MSRSSPKVDLAGHPRDLDAPGAVVTTSNKRDVLDATRNLRADAGPVWVFDPQAVARESATWWWNPLSYVTEDTRAAKLAGYFAAGSRAADAKTDAFFDSAGQNLLAGLLLFDDRDPAVERDIISAFTGRRFAGAPTVGTTSAPACIRIAGALDGNRFVALVTPPVDLATLASNRLRDRVAVTAGLVRAMVPLQLAARRLKVRTEFVVGTSLEHSSVSTESAGPSVARA